MLHSIHRFRGLAIAWVVLAHAYVFRCGLFEARESLVEPSMLPAIAHSLFTAQHMYVPF